MLNAQYTSKYQIYYQHRLHFNFQSLVMSLFIIIIIIISRSHSLFIFIVFNHADIADISELSIFLLQL